MENTNQEKKERKEEEKKREEKKLNYKIQDGLYYGTSIEEH